MILTLKEICEFKKLPTETSNLKLSSDWTPKEINHDSNILITKIKAGGNSHKKKI